MVLFSIDSSITERADGYNAVMEQAIEEKFGKCIWVQAERRAMEIYLEGLDPDQRAAWEEHFRQQQENIKESVEYLKEYVSGLDLKPEERFLWEEHIREIEECYWVMENFP